MVQISRDYVTAQQFLRQSDLIHLETLLRSLAVIPQAFQGNAEGFGQARSRSISALGDRVHEFVESRAEYKARRDLTFGLVVASLVVLLGLLVIFASSYVFDERLHLIDWGTDGYKTWRDGLVCVGAGAAGAATSVLIRLRHIDRVDYRYSNTAAAFFRVALGCFFALAVLCLVKSHFLTLLNDPSADAFNAASNPGGYTDIQIGFFWAALGFFAGFNERWVGSLLDAGIPDEAGSALKPPGSEAGPTADPKDGAVGGEGLPR